MSAELTSPRMPGREWYERRGHGFSAEATACADSGDGLGAPQARAQRLTRAQRSRRRRDLRQQRKGFQSAILLRIPAPPAPRPLACLPPPGFEKVPQGLLCSHAQFASEPSEVPVPGLEDDDSDLDNTSTCEQTQRLAPQSRTLPSQGSNIPDAPPENNQALAEVKLEAGQALQLHADYAAAQVAQIRRYQRARPTREYAAAQMALIIRYQRVRPTREYADAQVALIKKYVESPCCQDEKEEEVDETSRMKEAKRFLAQLDSAQAHIEDFDFCRTCSMCDSEVACARDISSIVVCAACEDCARSIVEGTL